MPSGFRIVVIGASAGGIPALEVLASGLPADLPAAVFVVVHMPDYERSYLAEILDRCGKLPAVVAQDGEEIRPGRIYVAQPGYHLLIDGGHVGVKRGPKENRFRPSIDALFRSAAYMARERVIGVVLSGMLSDGTSGLWTIKRFGGVAIVQDPQEAPFASMPVNAIEQVDVDHTLAVSEIGPAIGRLAAAAAGVAAVPEPEIVTRVKREVEVAVSSNAFSRDIMGMGEMTPFTCPECHGTLVRIIEGRLVRYRCHTGHAFTANALLSGITDSVETSLWNALRALEEAVMLLEHMARHFTGLGCLEDAELFALKADQTRERARILQEQATGSEHLSGDNLARARRAAGGSSG